MSDISIKNLGFKYDGVEVLKNVNLEYNSRDFLVIIGPNGGGKSTLLKLMLGLLNPTSGTVEIYGKPPLSECVRLGYVPQATNANPDFPMRAIEVVLTGLLNEKFFGFYSANDKKRAMNALEKVGIAELSNRRVGELSGGQRQRVYIARALVSKSDIIMLDEPTASIDAKGQADIYMLLKSLNENKKGIVLVSHDLNIALGFASKVAYVNQTLHMHEISPSNKAQFISHLAKEHSHFCDVEIALKECGCKIRNAV
ncbi:metal ABC transporter ATP-binding protein [Campylobacter sp. 19-13652]|uniref:metal ABC transporter ATP-binding protein n=1 Tax=Campylobacter sp. 19-13652 TaxID=2840180 RepID=UPI001C795151|nr:ABC transporter ATP-binding protein [Campylobacter sp. 19-13652]BCX78844.1 ABC transporter ATP-binding protein [Campylobacter sp. 19-13652]